MLKTFLRIACFNVIPAWLVSLIVVVALLPSVQNLHSSIATALADHLLPKNNIALQYRLSDVDAQAELTIRWPYRNAQNLSAYFSDQPVADHLQDVVANQPWLAPAISWVAEANQSVTPAAAHSWWQPASSGYKQAVHRLVNKSYLDHAVLRDSQSAHIGFTQATAGYISVPVDIFGGLYLFSHLAPKAELADSTNSQVFTLNQSNALSEQFLAELWAVDQQYWAVTVWQTLLVGAAMTALPWLLFGLKIKRLYPLVIVLTLANAGLLWLSFSQFSWFYPVVVPVLAPFLAWLWFAALRKKEQRLIRLTQDYQQSMQQWISHLLDDGKPEAAFRYLQERGQFTELAELWRMVAIGFERNRQFDRSLESYQSLLKQKPGDSTAKQKVKQLKEMLSGSATVAISQASAELPVGQVKDLTLGRYQIKSELGRGAMGVVYAAEDPKIHRKVAIKVVHLKSLGLDEVDQVKQRFFREAQAAGKLNHPNIVTVYDVGEEHDVAYIAMDLLIGQPMSDKVKSLPEDITTVVRWAAEAADALAYAHEHEVIHRDVKPANMIIESKSGRLKLTDFGVARIAGVQQTQTGIVLGSPSYMSPEQIRGEKLTGATDIFSLGVTLYQGLTGELPFAGETLPALAYGITQTKQESPRNLNPEVPISLVRIVNKSLQKAPADRYATAQDFAASLNKWLLEHQKQ